jgi:hypothetical protein
MALQLLYHKNNFPFAIIDTFCNQMIVIMKSNMKIRFRHL